MYKTIMNWLKDASHNVVVHPLMMLLPTKIATRFHDWHASHLWGNKHFDELANELPLKKGWHEGWCFMSNASPLVDSTVLALLDRDGVNDLQELDVVSDDFGQKIFMISGENVQLEDNVIIISWKYVFHKTRKAD